MLAFVGILLLSTNVYLIFQNKQLKSSLENSKQGITEEGYRFSDLHFRGADGSEEKINLANGESRTLLLVFNSSCEYCKQQFPYWIKLTKNIDTKIWKVFAISSEQDTEKLKALMAEQGIEDIKTGSVSLSEMRQARMLFTPMTIAVASDGEVKKVWAGLWTKEFDFSF